LLPDADSALKILGISATWKEKQVLGSVKYLYDVTITHNDLAYMKKVQYSTPNLLTFPIAHYLEFPVLRD